MALIHFFYFTIRHFTTMFFLPYFSCPFQWLCYDSVVVGESLPIRLQVLSRVRNPTSSNNEITRQEAARVNKKTGPLLHSPCTPRNQCPSRF